MRVLVIGAGMAGLALAQKLHSSGVDVAVFERGTAVADGMAGYGILIDGHGQRALKHCLPANIFEAFDRAAGHAGVSVHFLDEMARTLTAFEGPAGPSGQAQRRSIERLKLRSILLGGLEGPGSPIQWGKEFTSYEILGEDGRVRAHFSDGSHADGDVLVGADASNSRVRAQYLNGLKRLDLGITNLVGRTPLTADLLKGLPRNFIDGSVNNVVPPGPGWMFLSAWRTAARNGAADETGNYLVWAYAAARKDFPDSIEKLQGHVVTDIVLRRMEKWSPTLRNLVLHSDMETVKAVPIRSMPELPYWKPSQITLVGDAIHNMTPMAGIGANTALRDAAILADRLIAAGKDKRAMLDGIGAYEKAMRTYANSAVGLSRLNAERAAHGGVISRRFFRSFLRVVDAVPPLKRKVFEDLSKKYDN